MVIERWGQDEEREKKWEDLQSMLALTDMQIPLTFVK